MAQPVLLGSVDLCFAYRNKTSGTSTTAALATPANYASPTTLDTRLAAINGSLYTAIYLSKMTLNDKIYAVRVADDAASI